MDFKILNFIETMKKADLSGIIETHLCLTTSAGENNIFTSGYSILHNTTNKEDYLVMNYNNETLVKTKLDAEIMAIIKLIEVMRPCLKSDIVTVLTRADVINIKTNTLLGKTFKDLITNMPEVYKRNLRIQQSVFTSNKIYYMVDNAASENLIMVKDSSSVKASIPVKLSNEKNSTRRIISCKFDGACDPNPGGDMGWGYVINSSDNSIQKEFYDGRRAMERNSSNNMAEHLALKSLMEFLHTQDLTDAKVVIKGDSQLVIQQMNGHWKVGSNSIYSEVGLVNKEISARLGKKCKLVFEWIGRKYNADADLLSKRGMSLARKNFT